MARIVTEEPGAETPICRTCPKCQVLFEYTVDDREEREEEVLGCFLLSHVIACPACGYEIMI